MWEGEFVVKADFPVIQSNVLWFNCRHFNNYYFNSNNETDDLTTRKTVPVSGLKRWMRCQRPGWTGPAGTPQSSPTTETAGSTIVQLFTSCMYTTHSLYHTHTQECAFHIATTPFHCCVALCDSNTQRESQRGQKNRNLFKCHRILNMVLQQHARLSIPKEKQNVHTILRAPRQDLSFSSIWFISFLSFFFFWWLLLLQTVRTGGKERRKLRINKSAVAFLLLHTTMGTFCFID